MRKFKGFTLVECLVAMAILAIACMTLGGIEASVARRNRFNHFANSSLANQMAYVEKYENAETVKINNTITSGTTTPPTGTNSGATAYVQVTKVKHNSTNTVDLTNLDTNSKCSFPVDIYVMYSRDTNNKSSKDAAYGDVAGSMSTNSVDTSTNDSKTTNTENSGNLRYKYLLGHTS